jgi:hypothetical protein
VRYLQVKKKSRWGMVLEQPGAISDEGIDAGPDIGIKNNFGDPTTPILGVSLPVFGGRLFLEHNWNNKGSNTIGYSGLRI